MKTPKYSVFTVFAEWTTLRCIVRPPPLLYRIPRPVSASFARLPPRPHHTAHRLPNRPHCTRSSKHQIIQGEEPHLRKTWPSTAPPNAGPSTHDPISPTTLPAPMPVSTPSLPKAQFGQRTAYCMGLRARIAPAHKQRARTTSNTIATHINSHRALGFRVSRSAGTCRAIWSAPGRFLRPRLSPSCENLQCNAQERPNRG